MGAASASEKDRQMAQRSLYCAVCSRARKEQRGPAKPSKAASAPAARPTEEPAAKKPTRRHKNKRAVTRPLQLVLEIKKNRGILTELFRRMHWL